jgi:hypothetical protein
MALTAYRFWRIKQTLEIGFPAQAIKIEVLIFCKNLCAMGAATETNFLPVVEYRNRVSGRLFSETRRTDMNIPNLFDKALWMFLENIGATLATEEIHDLIIDSLCRLVVGNSKPHQRAAAGGTNFNVHYAWLSIGFQISDAVALGTGHRFNGGDTMSKIDEPIMNANPT